MDVYTKFATDNNNLKDQFKNDVYIAGVEQLSGLGVVALQASLAIQENPDSPEATEAVERLTAAMSAYYSVGQQIANIAVESRNTPRRNIHGVSNYDELTPAAQLRLDSMTADEFNKAYGQ
jgi:uncharacterized protein YoaH (UPF0181 family)